VRFDARFFMADAAALAGDPDDFSKAEAELSHLRWLTLEEARDLDLPFVTAMVLAEVALRLARPDEDRPAPFFHHVHGRPLIDALS
jgi:8-oxo-dGTP pyrophosphatase MutT (NUDIX family)